jgi:hypothetical protein
MWSLLKPKPKPKPRQPPIRAAKEPRPEPEPKWDAKWEDDKEAHVDTGASDDPQDAVVKVYDAKASLGVEQFLLTFTSPPGGALDPTGAFKNSPVAPSGAGTAGRFLVSNGLGGVKFSTPMVTQYVNFDVSYSTTLGAHFYAVGLAQDVADPFLYTPSSSGNLLISLNFAMTETIAAGSSHWDATTYYGDINGTPAVPAPAQGAFLDALSPPATQVGTFVSIPTVAATTLSTVQLTIPIFGLTLGHQYWFDVGIKELGTANTITASNFNAVIAEF